MKKINEFLTPSISGIEDSDLILLIGCDPRYEATMINARLRKASPVNKTKIYSIEIQDLTYQYEFLVSQFHYK